MTTDVQRPLAAGALAPFAFGAARVPPPIADAEEDPHAGDAGVAVRSLEELEALLAGPGPLGARQSDAHDHAADEVPAPPFDPAANDHQPMPGDAPRIDTERAPAIDQAGFRARVTEQCCDRLLQLARDRAGHPLRYRARDEARMLRQLDALCCIGEPAWPAMLAWRDRARSPHATWVMVFVLGCMRGQGAIDAIAALPLWGAEDAEHAADAFACAPHPDVRALAAALIGSGSPTARAFAIEALSKRGAIGADDLLAWLRTGDPTVVAAAARSVARDPSLARPPDELGALLAADDGGVVWEAARALSAWGSSAAYQALPSGLGDRLGARVAEIYVMCGEPSDLKALQRVVDRHPPSEALLDAIARFGDPSVWSFLTHHLGDGALREEAHAALVTLFGQAVPDEARHDPFAWDKAIGALRLSPELRYRRGKPWSPATVAAEWAGGVLSAERVGPRLDELRARAGVSAPVALHGWGAAPMDGLARIEAQAAEAARTHRAGDWYWR